MKIQIKLEAYEPRSKSNCWKCSMRGKWILSWRDADSMEHDQGEMCGDFWDDDLILVCELHLAESIREVQKRPAIIAEWIKVVEAKAMDMSDPETAASLYELEQELESPEMKRMIRQELALHNLKSDVKAEQRDWEAGE